LLWQRRKSLRKLPWAELFILGLAMLAAWGMTLIRGSNYIFIRSVFIPVARYGYAVMAPTLLVLTAGWFAWLQLFQAKLRLPDWSKYLLYLLLFLALDAFSLLSIIHYYQG
jgi:hypothetical protein